MSCIRVGQPHNNSHTFWWAASALPYRDLPPELPPNLHMSSSGASPSLADRLVTACYDGDLPSAEAAVADGASVHEKGMDQWGSTWLPLAIAVNKQNHAVVAWLLSHGADPNGDEVVYSGAFRSTAAILQLLIDAGGDVNRESCGRPPLFPAVLSISNSKDTVRVLLAQPSLEFAIESYDGETPEQYARDFGTPVVADMIAQEVSGKGLPVLFGSH